MVARCRVGDLVGRTALDSANASIGCCCELPWVGATVRKFSTSQLARTLATLLGGGIPLVNALEIAGRAMTNRHFGVELQEVTRRVREGESFAAALLRAAVFPDVAVKMVEVGESTGALQEMLNSLADFYDEEIETEVARFITLIEPVILVVMGVVIAAVVLALYMPLFELELGRWVDRDNGNCRSRTTWFRPPRTTRRRWRTRAGWPSGTAWSSSTWTNSGSTRSCSDRFRRT